MLGNRLRRRPVAEDVLILATGIGLWVVYGTLKGDLVIILANAVSLCLLFGILYFKLREMYSGNEPAQA